MLQLPVRVLRPLDRLVALGPIDSPATVRAAVAGAESKQVFAAIATDASNGIGVVDVDGYLDDLAVAGIVGAAYSGVLRDLG